jgi:hypothetical protein
MVFKITNEYIQGRMKMTSPPSAERACGRAEDEDGAEGEPALEKRQAHQQAQAPRREVHRLQQDLSRFIHALYSPPGWEKWEKEREKGKVRVAVARGRLA